MRDAKTIILAVLLGFLIGILRTTREGKTADGLEGWEVVSCKLVEQRGDTIITINKLIKMNYDE